MTAARRLRTAQSEELGHDRLAELTRLCEAAFDEPFAAAWERVGPGVHVMAEAGGRVLAHAMVVDRRIYLGHEMDVALDAGYVEHVATVPDAQGAGHATVVMEEIGRILKAEYELGALATGSNSFYRRLGWETWAGPTGLRMADGERVRSTDEDGHVMVLRTPRSPADLSVDAPIAVDWRMDRAW